MMNRIYSASYYPVGDLIVVSICLVMVVLMMFSYNRKSRSLRIFLGLIGLLMLSAFSNIIFHVLAQTGKSQYFGLINAIRCVYHASLFSIFSLYVAYILEVTQLEKEKSRRYMAASLVIFLAIVFADVWGTLNGRAFRFSDNGYEFKRRNIFFYGYIVYMGLIVVLMADIRNRLYKKVMMGFYGSMLISLVMLFLQGLRQQSSFTVATFLYPVIAMFYIMHSNPYDAKSGAIDSRSLDDLIRYNYGKGIDFIFMSLYMPEFDDESQAMPEELQATIRDFSIKYFRGATLFQIGAGHLILITNKKKNRDFEARIRQILQAFDRQYRRFMYDYKIVIGESIAEISRDNEYANFIRDVHRSMEKNSVYRVNEEDVTRFKRYEALLEELEDICDKNDMDDPRVLVYCQPVYNIKTKQYDTAEALMRLNLESLGMVYPDRFIPMAEENGQIHMLTKIILHKTCEAVRKLIAEGFEVSRVSVNVSAIELKNENFCEDIIGIINQSGIPGERIAIELTESRTDSDFDHMKQMIEALRQHGIKFYLDDFGTGYSNMERIMELPFDIIKFDRSMVLASEASERSKAIVFSLANMFDGLNYSVLYEGVEKESEERMCMDMSASYLQGYKYSRPVPIEKLVEYFSKA